jgi:hypothetical protein
MLKLVVFVCTRNNSLQFKTKKRENTNCQQLDFLLFLCSVFVFHSVHNDNKKIYWACYIIVLKKNLKS